MNRNLNAPDLDPGTPAPKGEEEMAPPRRFAPVLKGSANSPVEDAGAPPPGPSTRTDMDNAVAGDRGASSGRNIEQSREIGQDSPAEGSRMGREAYRKGGHRGTPGLEANAAQLEEAKKN